MTAQSTKGKGGTQILIPYLRQSRGKEETISIDAQMDAIEAWAAQHPEVTLGAAIIEQGVSGSKRWQDRELGAGINAVTGWTDEDGTKHPPCAAGIIVAFQDRLSREQALGTAEVWEALTGSRFVAAAEGLDTATGSGPDGELLFSIKAAVARHQWKRYQANWDTATAKGIEKGRYVGAAPVGYTRADGLARGVAQTVMPGAKDGRLIKNDYAPAIEAAFRIRANGGSWSECAQALVDAGVPTPTGQMGWGTSSVRSMMANPIYMGQLKNGHVHVFPEYVIVPPSIWRKVNPNGTRATQASRPKFTYTYDVRKGIERTKIEYERSEAQKSKKGREDAGTWAILGGLVFCGGCGLRMTPKTEAKINAAGDLVTYHSYVCNKPKTLCKEKASISATDIEPHVIPAAVGYFAQAISLVGLGHDADTERIGALEIEADAAAKRLSNFLAVASVDDFETEAEYAARVEELRAAKHAAQTAVEEERAATRRYPTPEEVEAIFETGTVPEKRQALRMAVVGVTVWRKGVEAHDVAGEPGGLRGEPVGTKQDIEVAYRTVVA
jgi:hypothetical protein